MDEQGWVPFSFNLFFNQHIKLKLAMFGVLRLKVVGGSSSASIVGKSWRTSRPVVPTNGTCFASEGEVLLHPGIIGNVRSICHVTQPGATVNLRPLREVMTSLQPCVSMQMQSRKFSSDLDMIFIYSFCCHFIY
ncbi:hypothetical protein L1987_55687 [Smallanthus sonchifolius]|uniref:Uncharacterized protein n=1 Tax=Smallanthus sonchifolius TaxID=185202 RepID=A0ACB9EBC5_9ASTR|nr:hypothetical protein L1987_55687 [Smallanthus sonchifolius]